MELFHRPETNNNTTKGDNNNEESRATAYQ